MRSPAVPPSRRALRAALYSFGAEGANSIQMSASSLRQLSIFSEPASVAASPANNATAATPATTAPLNVRFMLSSLARALALGGSVLSPRGAREAQRVINPSFRCCEPCHGFAHADA